MKGFVFRVKGLGFCNSGAQVFNALVFFFFGVQGFEAFGCSALCRSRGFR